jgi:hypothetical protein
MVLLAAWAGRPNGPAGRVGREAEWSYWPRGPGGLMGRLAAWAERPNVKEKNFWIKKLDF